MAGVDDLLLHPESEGEGAGTTAKHGVGAIVGLLEHRIVPLLHTQTREAQRRSAGSSFGSRQPTMCWLGREMAGVSMIFENFFTI